MRTVYHEVDQTTIASKTQIASSATATTTTDGRIISRNPQRRERVAHDLSLRSLCASVPNRAVSLSGPRVRTSGRGRLTTRGGAAQDTSAA
jgi:hypothetical protein